MVQTSRFSFLRTPLFGGVVVLMLGIGTTYLRVQESETVATQTTGNGKGIEGPSVVIAQKRQQAIAEAKAKGENEYTYTYEGPAPFNLPYN